MTVPSENLERGSWLIHSQEAVLDHWLHPAPGLSLSRHPVLRRKLSSFLPLVFAYYFTDFSQNKYELPEARVPCISCAVFPVPKTGSGTGGHLIIHLLDVCTQSMAWDVVVSQWMGGKREGCLGRNGELPVLPVGPWGRGPCLFMSVPLASSTGEHALHG